MRENTVRGVRVTRDALWQKMFTNALAIVATVLAIACFGSYETLCLAVMWLAGCSLEERALHVGHYTREVLAPRVLRILDVKMEYKGLECFADRRSYVVVANHGSLFDIVAMLVVPRFRFVAKLAVATYGPIGSMGKLGGQIFIDNKKKGASMGVIRAAIREWPSANLIFFGEGTRVESDRVEKLERGSAATAIEFDCPIVPVYISGAREVLGPRAAFLSLVRGKTITVTFGKPIELCPGESVPELSERVRAAMNQLRES